MQKKLDNIRDRVQQLEVEDNSPRVIHLTAPGDSDPWNEAWRSSCGMERKACEPEEHFLMRCAIVAEKENRVITVFGGESCPPQ